MRVARTTVSLGAALAAIVLLDGCASKHFEKTRLEKREKMLATYPVGTSRAEIREKLKDNSTFIDTVTRPAAGWNSGYTGILQAEQRTGKSVYRCDFYWLNDSYNLSKTWFYYDEQDKLVDVDWGGSD